MFPIKPNQSVGIRLNHFFFLFPNSLIRAKNQFVKNGTANFGGNISAKISGPLLEVIPNVPVRRNRNGPFRIFRISLTIHGNAKDSGNFGSDYRKRTEGYL